MTGAARRQAYLAQTGRRWLTPRQRRRAEHKEGRERQRALVQTLRELAKTDEWKQALHDSLNEVSPGRVTGQGS